MLKRIICALARRSGRDGPRGPRCSKHELLARFCPSLEALEDRRLLSVTIQSYSVPSPHALPAQIAAGADGNLWFVEQLSGQIGKISPTTHAVVEYPLPTGGSGPENIAAGPDGNLWFTETDVQQIGDINPVTHAITEYRLPQFGSFPVGIAAGPDGNIWFTVFGANQIGEMDLSTHTISEYPIPTASSAPAGITAGPDGNLWFVETTANKIGTINPTTHVISEYDIPTAQSFPETIALGPDHNLWFNDGNQIGAIDPTTDVITAYPLPDPLDGVTAITSGPDGNLWFTEALANSIGAIDPVTHAIHQYPVQPAHCVLLGITSGPGGTLWFVQGESNQVGEVQIVPDISSDPSAETIDAGQTTTFTAAATGGLTPVVQWLISTDHGKTFKPLTNGGIYSGVNTDTLTVSAAPTSVNGDEYEAVFSNSMDATARTFTTPAMLTVKPALPIAKLSVTFTSYAVPTASSLPVGITAGPDGNLWFTEGLGNRGRHAEPDHPRSDGVSHAGAK